MADISMEQRKEGGEMTETETAIHQNHHQQVASNSNSDQPHVVRDLLVMARHLINQGKPSQALQAVIFSFFYFLDFRLSNLMFFCLFVLTGKHSSFFTIYRKHYLQSFGFSLFLCFVIGLCVWVYTLISTVYVTLLCVS